MKGIMSHKSIEINNLVTDRDKIPSELVNNIPEGAMYFEGIISSNDKNRNGYIIETDAWFFDNGKHIDSFLKNGSVLWNHDSNKPIGRPLSFKKVKGDDGKELLWTNGYVFDDVHTNGAIGRGIVKGFSTCHLTHASLYRHVDTGEEIESKEFSKKLWDDDTIYIEYINGKWVWVVTEAEMIEYSWVTTPSNRDSSIDTQKNFLINSISQEVGVSEKEVKNYINNSIPMKKTKENQVDEIKKVDDVKTNDKTETTETPETTEKQENKIDTEALENSIYEKLENKFKDKIETLENTIAELKENNAKAREDKKEAVRALANKQGVTDSEVNSLQDVQKKYK